MDIISISWGEEYAVTNKFDLNCLRGLCKVKEINGKYIYEGDSNIIVKINKTMLETKEEVDNELLEHEKQQVELYKNWYNQEQKEKKKIQCELEVLKNELANTI